MSKKNKKTKLSNTGVLATNRKARHDYTILDTWECGLVLQGTEIKALREGKVSLVEAFATTAGVEVETRDISLAGRIIALFPERLSEDQRLDDALAELGELAKTPEARYPDAVALYGALEALKAGADASWSVPLLPERRPAVKPWPNKARGLAAVGVGLAVALGAWWLGSGQEVAPGGPAPEPVRAVAAPRPEVPRKDSAPVKQQPQTSGPQPEAVPTRRKAAVRAACLGLTGAALQACMSAPQQVPPERPAPPPQACPAGAVETMTDMLGLRLGERKTMAWSEPNIWNQKPVRVDADTPLFVPGHWEAGAHLSPGMVGYKVALPDTTRFFGRLYFGETRVYGRFTEARTPLGVTYPVCLEMLDTMDRVGVELEPGSGPGKMLVSPVVVVRVVDRFK